MAGSPTVLDDGSDGSEGRRTTDVRHFRAHAGDGFLLLGGGTAILLQLADPRVARGVREHSDFAARPLDRLFGTLDYLYVVGFAEPGLVSAMARRVNARHVKVRGRMPRASSSATYSAFDRDAQLYVAQTLAWTALAVHERVIGPLTSARADAIIRGYEPLATALQVPPGSWPTTRARFDDLWNERMAHVDVGDDARSVTRTLLSAGTLPRGIRPLAPVLRLVTAALLPAPIRTSLGFVWTPRAERVANLLLDAFAVAHRIAPRPLREVPKRTSLVRARRELGADETRRRNFALPLDRGTR